MTPKKIVDVSAAPSITSPVAAAPRATTPRIITPRTDAPRTATTRPSTAPLALKRRDPSAPSSSAPLHVRKRIDRVPVGRRAGERKPFERKGFGAKSFDRKPFERKSFERKSFERKPFDRKPGGRPAGRPFDNKFKPHAPRRDGGPQKLALKRTPNASRDSNTIDLGPGAIRLNKYIASAGIASRRKADELITAGAVTVNGKVITELGSKVKPYEDHIAVHGEPISTRPKYLYLLLNKPKDTIATTNDEKDRTTVLDYVKTEERVYPVGRLDRNTTGVLLLTNDGELTNRLTHPSFEIAREYHVTLDKPLAIDDAKKIAEGGLAIGDGDITGKVEVTLNPKDKREAILLLREGKNREVRRIFESLGYDVEKLDRVRFAGLTHQGMGRGETRSLTNSEVHALRRLAGIETE